MLTRLLYASRATDPIDDVFLKSVLESSRSHNLEHGITGILCVYQKGNVFLQALEGARTAVNTLYCSIVRDPRHRDITLLDYTEIEQRLFAGWRMGTVEVGTVNLSSILRYSEKAALDPYSMTGRAALALLQELTTSGAIVSHD